MGDVLGTLLTQLGAIESPLMQFARSIQDTFALAAPDARPAPSVPSDAPGGRPTANEIAATTLDIDGTIDHDRTRRSAEATLASIDWSRPDIALWVPATNSHTIPDSWQAAVAASRGAGLTSSALVDYPADIDFQSSVATGAETLRLVLEGIARHGGDHRVLLGGHSQGAWVIAETMENPVLHAAVDRAVTYGRPAPSREVTDLAQDPKVLDVVDADDPFTATMSGAGQALDAIRELKTGGSWWGAATKLAPVLLVNPFLGAYIISRTALPGRWGGESDPHHYEPEYVDGVAFLQDGTRPDHRRDIDGR